MNFLGHIYLSGNDDHLMMGNFIGDYVKGKKYLEYPDRIQQGIHLHRLIDSYTDNHPNFRLIRNQLRPIYGLYSGVVTDLFIDHFLAANWTVFHPVDLEAFTKEVYQTMQENYTYLPERIKGFFNNLVERNRLLSYAEINGIEEALMIMAFRTSLPEKTVEAIKLLKDQYPSIKELSMQFLSEITVFVENRCLV
jgi:acyl carrier protein phosphodiesterase